MNSRLWLAASIVVLYTSPVHAWWNSGHSYLTHSAVRHLPAPLRIYVENYLSTIDEYASSEPPGQHYIDIDLYPEFHAGQMPRDLNVLYNTYTVPVVDARGKAPWTIANHRATLTTRMSNRQDADDLELVARSAGQMAHYIEDINNPLHTTDNHNGQHTGNLGIHSRYEGTMIVLNFDDLPIAAAPQNCVYVADTVDWVLDTIETRTWDYVDDIMAADTLARTFGSTSSLVYYDSLWDSTGDFTHSQFQFASEMVAGTVWYSAWIDAGRPWLGVSGDYNDDGVIDAADYVVWRKNANTSNTLPNDFTPGTVDNDDLLAWKANFGLSIDEGSGAVVEQSVPEPPTMLLGILVVLLTAASRTKQHPVEPRKRASAIFVTARLNRPLAV